MATDSRGAAARVRAALCTGMLAALTVAATGCSTPDTAPTTIPTPSISVTAEWGSYGSREDACFGVAGDLLTLSLVPNNLALADPGTGVSDIDETIRTAAGAAPPAIAADYQQLSALVRSFGVQLSAWSTAASPAATATPTPTPTPGAPRASASTTPSPTASRPATPDRPAFDDAPYETRLASIKTWLSTTCG